MIISMCHRISGERLKSKQMVLRIVSDAISSSSALSASSSPLCPHSYLPSTSFQCIDCCWCWCIFAWLLALQMGMAVRNGKRSPFSTLQTFPHFRFISYFHLLVVVMPIEESWAQALEHHALCRRYLFVQLFLLYFNETRCRLRTRAKYRRRKNMPNAHRKKPCNNDQKYTLEMHIWK